MSGHSKWSTIKRKKEATDSKRAAIFTKIGREMAVAIKEGGGPDPGVNFRLANVIQKAKMNNIPNDNIERALKKASGEDGSKVYESLVYEGYGPCGVAVIVEALTENRNRTAGDMRHYFDKYGGNLGTSGCVSFMFEEKGVIVLDSEDRDEDEVMEQALEAGASDFITDDGAFIIHTEPGDLTAVHEALQKQGYEFVSAQVEQVPSTYVALPDEEHQVKMHKLLDALEDNDDVQNVWHNFR